MYSRCGYVEIPVEDSIDIDLPMDLIIAQQILDQTKGIKE